MSELLCFHDFVRHWAREKPTETALQQDQRALTFAELNERTARIASWLEAAGLGKGDRIAWLGKNSLSYFTLFYGAARAGIIMAPIGWRLTPPEIAHVLADGGAKLLVYEKAFASAAEDAAKNASRPPRRIEVSELEQAIEGHPSTDFTPSGPDDAVLQLYTSGTTGKPKGAVLSNRNLFSLRLPGLREGVPWARWKEGEAILVCMPCAHIGGTGLGVMAMGVGARAIIQAEFSPEGVLDAIEAGITRLFIVPAALQLVVQHPRAASTDFSSVRFLMYGAAPIPLELLRQAVSTMPEAGFVQCYGMTETAGTVTALFPEDHELAGNPRMRSAGRALPGVKLKVCDEQGGEVPRGTIGELCVHAPSNMVGYHEKPEATAEALSDGWMRTGDAAYLDEVGYVFIQDRIKDMIISGGENVYPAEVESELFAHPDIAEVAVIGVPDARWGEAVKAVVVPRAGAKLEEADVLGFASTRLASFKVPKSVDWSDALPRNPSGKILRRELRAPYWEGSERQVN
jgi:fatty-acyl-CoA synthase